MLNVRWALDPWQKNVRREKCASSPGADLRFVRLPARPGFAGGLLDVFRPGAAAGRRNSRTMTLGMHVHLQRSARRGGFRSAEPKPSRSAQSSGPARSGDEKSPRSSAIVSFFTVWRAAGSGY